MANAIEAEYHVAREKIHVVYNGFRRDAVVTPTRVGALADLIRRRFVPTGFHTIIFVVRIVPMKGVMELLKSAEIVCREIPNVRYLIAGRPMLNDYTRALMQLVDGSPLLKRAVACSKCR
jgi:glycosyltransferase involved in cell wall biosynthesis